MFKEPINMMLMYLFVIVLLFCMMYLFIYNDKNLTFDNTIKTNTLNTFEKFNDKQYEFVILLQPTSPVRSEKQIYDAIEAILKNKYDSVISVSSVSDKYHPYKQFELINNLLKPFSNIASRVIARQQLSKSYIRNGIVYIFSRSFALRSSSVFSKNSGYTIIDEPYVNIDTTDDLAKFENLLHIHKL